MPKKNLFGEPVAAKLETEKPKRKPRKKKEPEIGCDFCPMNKVPGIRKVINLEAIKGKKAFLWAQSPGKHENAVGRELVGKAGQFLWETLKLVQLTRDSFDIQNVIRCRPWDGKQEHQSTTKPFKKILQCCSIYNQQALDKNRGKAIVHLVLGKVAGKKLLGKAFQKGKSVIWYEPWNAYVVTAEHPSYLLRLGGKRAGGTYLTFRDRMKAVRTIINYPGRWGYVKSPDRNYGAIETPEEMRQFKEFLLGLVHRGESISLDVEDGTVGGQKVPLLIGFGWGSYSKDIWEGGARSVVLYHPQASQSPKRIEPILKMLRSIIEDPNIKKVLQHGSYDDNEVIQKQLGWRLRGYEYDTQYGTYLKYPDLRGYSLDRMVHLFLSEFGDYKDMADPWKNNFADAPLEDLVIYNCADADATKRLQCKFSGVNHELLKVYIHCAYILEDMEPRGPFVDDTELNKLAPIVHDRVQFLKRQLEQITGGGKKDFNPNTPAHIAWLLFDKLKMPKIEGRSTKKEVMEALEIKTGSDVPALVTEYRSWAKLEGTSLKGYEKSAANHNGRLATIWHLTGAVTGRLRSGKSDKAEAEEGIVNLQNIDSRPLVQNLIVSDPKWRLAL